jgi:hypothetical protein
VTPAARSELWATGDFGRGGLSDRSETRPLIISRERDRRVGQRNDQSGFALISGHENFWPVIFSRHPNDPSEKRVREIGTRLFVAEFSPRPANGEDSPIADPLPDCFNTVKDLVSIARTNLVT